MTKTTFKERHLFTHGWIRGKRKDGRYDWLYPGDMKSRSFQEAVEITINAYPELLQNQPTMTPSQIRHLRKSRDM